MRASRISVFGSKSHGGRPFVYAPIAVIFVTLAIGAVIYQLPRGLRVDLGSENDRGLTQGFNEWERNASFDFRWTRAESSILLPSLASGDYTVDLGAAAPRPDGVSPRVELFLDGRPIGAITVDRSYRRFPIRVHVAPNPLGNHTLTFRTATMTETGRNTRALGIALDDVALRPARLPMIPPLLPLLALLSDTLLGYALLSRWSPRVALPAATAVAFAAALATVALRRPLGPPAFQLLIPLAFVGGVGQCAVLLRRRNWHPAAAACALCALAIATLSLLDFVLRLYHTDSPTDFRIFYGAADAVWRGHPGDIYDLAAIKADPLLGFHFRQPPLAAALIAPLAALSFPTALALWRLILAGCIAGGIALLAREFTLDRGMPAGWPLAALVFLTFLWDPLRVSVSSGQWDAPLFLLLALALVALRRRWFPVAGGALALAGMLKVYPLYLGLFLLWKREWRALAWLVGALFASAALGVAFAGWGATRTFVLEVLPRIGGSTGFAQNQSLSSLFLRLFGVDAVQGGMVTAISIGCFLAVTVVLSLLLRLTTTPDDPRYALGYGLTLSGMILVSPVAWDHYETVLLLPVGLTLAVLATPGAPALLSAPWLTVFGASIALLTIGQSRAVPDALGAQTFQYEAITRALLTSIRVFAQIGLLLLLWQIARSVRAPDRADARLPDRDDDPVPPAAGALKA